MMYPVVRKWRLGGWINAAVCALTLLCPLTAWSQGASKAHSLRYEADAAYRQRTDQIEDMIYRDLNLSTPAGNISRGLLVVPVVVHIMHLPQDSTPAAGSSNPTDAQIIAGLSYLNDAFRNRSVFHGGPYFSNAGIPAADIEIEFCLAQSAPGGATSTGITRTSTAMSNLFRDEVCTSGTGNSQDACLKNLAYWDSRGYLNIWLVNSICASQNNDCGLKGYAFMPGAHGQSYDGIVLESDVWGLNAENTIPAVQFAGVYLGLFETSFDPVGAASPCDNENCITQGDKVCDTPPDASPTGGNCANGERINSCSNDAQDSSPNNPFDSDVEDLYENFMDGSSYACRNSFTPGQKARMRWNLLNSRTSLIQNSVCSIVYENVEVTQITEPSELICSNTIQAQVLFTNSGNITLTSVEVLYYTAPTINYSFTWTGQLAPGASKLVTLPALTLTSGLYDLVVKVQKVNGGDRDDNPNDDILTRKFFILNAIGQSAFPYCLGFGQPQLPAGWMVANLNRDFTWDQMPYSYCAGSESQVLRYKGSEGLAVNNVPPGQPGPRDLFISPLLDLTEFSSATLTFDVAYRLAPAGQNISLKVLALEDCNLVSAALYEKSGYDLQTSPANTIDPYVWEPLACSEWRGETLNLTQYAGRKVRLIFMVALETHFSPDLYIDNICINAEKSCDKPTAIPSSPGTYIASRMCTDAQGWTHYIKDAAAAPVSPGDLLLFSVKNLTQTGTELLPSGVKMVVTPDHGQTAYNLSGASYAQNYLGWFAAGRYLEITAALQPRDSALVRIYYDETDLSDLNKAIVPAAMTTEAQLVFYNIPGDVGTDPLARMLALPDESYEEYRYGAAPSQKRWSSDTAATLKYAEMWAGNLQSFGLGSGGDGLGGGARYPLRLHLNGEQWGEKILLNWSTERERECVSYELFRSLNGAPYELAGTAPSLGSWVQGSYYETEDAAPEMGVVRYYAEQVHVNGMRVRTDTLEVGFDPARLVRVFPNPAVDLIRIRLDAAPTTPEQVEFVLTNASHQKIAGRSWTFIPDVPEWMDVSSLPPGIYYYKIFFQGKVYRGKILKV